MKSPLLRQEEHFKPGTMAGTVIPALRRWQQDQKFKVILSNTLGQSKTHKFLSQKKKKDKNKQTKNKKRKYFVCLVSDVLMYACPFYISARV